MEPTNNQLDFGHKVFVFVKDLDVSQKLVVDLCFVRLTPPCRPNQLSSTSFLNFPSHPPPPGCLSGLQQFLSTNFSSFSKSDLTFDCRSLMNIILRAIWFINYIPAKPVVESILGSRRCISNFPPISGCCLPVQASLARIPIQLGCQVKKNTACKDSCHTTLLTGTTPTTSLFSNFF